MERKERKSEWVWIKKAPKELAEKYGVYVKENTLRQWHFYKRFPGMFSKLGGKVYVDLQVVLKMLEAGREEEDKIRNKIQRAVLLK